ncbi:MAG: aminopeptidase [Clostridia bacterium]|nr:aminopeptidase [Clostridia bacterium]
MKKSALKAYARLLAVSGLGIRMGDEVVIVADLDQPEFVRMVVEECYQAGAEKVNVEWRYQPLEKVHVRHRTLKVLSTVEEWEKAKYAHRAERLPALLRLISEDPDGLKGMNQKKNSRAMQLKYPIIKPYEDQMENKYKWCVAAVPGRAWAKKMFPEMRPMAAMEKLWQVILYTVHMSDSIGGEIVDGVAAWKEHNEQFRARCEYLNALDIVSLHIRGGNGTDLTVGLVNNGLFCGGGEYTLSGEWFNPNMPTEEIFTTPKRGDAEGIVYSTKPLSYRGQLIENFSVRFEGGRAVEVHAEKNEALLKEMISMDEGAAFLGEVALVPAKSPISSSGLTFYETLFDENASCHLALGAGYTNTVRDYDKYTLEELHAMGINDSMIHVDFMIGTEDLCVVARTVRGKEIVIFRDGNWAF